MSQERQWQEQHGSSQGEAQGAADVAMRQLRRRYESLRGDYEQLLDRLGELEARMEQPGSTPAPEPGAARLGEQVQRAILSPIYSLRDEYAAAAAEMQSLATSLESVARGAFKGQHPAAQPTAPAPGMEQRSREAAPPPPPPPEPPRPEPEPAPTAPAPEQPERRRDTGPQTAHIEVASPNLGTLLDFQERLSRIEGVARVSMSQVTAERAMLVVELEEEQSEES
ncbi:MAG: hypothetical protein U5Q44_07790 [Dehalococcoidia bacterium]|nr:hypothetical protein [Dehalococcoidia bacterium]